MALSRKAKRPVKLVMSREEVFKASGPTSGARVKVKLGATKDGKFTAAFAELKYQAGAFQGSPVQPGTMCAFAPYDIEHVKVIGYDVVSNRPKVAAYRAPGAPISEYGVRGVGETPIVPPMAAIANAIESATGIRFTELPMSPPKVLKALKARGLNRVKA